VLPLLPQNGHPVRREQVPVAQHQGCPAAVALRRVEEARQPAQLKRLEQQAQAGQQDPEQLYPEA